MKAKEIVIAVFMLVAFAVPAHAEIVKEMGTVCFADGNGDGLSEQINFAAVTSHMIDVFPDDPLGEYVGFDAACGMEKSYASFPSLELSGEVGYEPICEEGDTDCDPCQNGELLISEGVYPEGYKLFVLDSATCEYVEVLRTDIIIKDAPLSNWCPESRFAFEFNHAVINNFMNSPLLDYFASQPECPYSWGTVSITSDIIKDFGAKIKAGESFCADAKFAHFPGVACSGCDDCGVESNGRMASQMAQRHYLRGRSAVCSDPNGEGVSCEKLMIDPRLKKSTTAVNLEQLLPDFDALGLQSFPSTPEHLAEITNATDLIAVDHFKDGAANGSILLLETISEPYEHSKIICDRVAGDTLEYVMSVTLKGMSFPVAIVSEKATGKRSFAVSMVVSQSKIFSRLRITEYPKFEGSEVYNIQLWACSPREMERILRAELDKLESIFGMLEYDTASRFVPDTYIMAAEKVSNDISLRLSGADKQLKLVGKYWAEENANQSVDFMIDVPEGGSLTSTLPEFIDMDALLMDENGQVYDQIYLSDGGFTAFDDSAFGDGTSSTTSAINESCERPVASEEGDLTVTGCASLKGSVDGYGVISRPMLGGASPYDLNGFESVNFQYRSNSETVMCIESQSRYGLANNCINLPSTDGWKTREIKLADFELYGEGKPAVLDDIVALSWNAWNPDRAAGSYKVDMAVQAVTFKKVAGSAADETAAAAGCSSSANVSGLALLALLGVAFLRRRSSVNN